MTDDEWERQRARAISATFRTGRPVFADSDGALRFDDGDRETLPAESPATTTPSSPRVFTKALRAYRAAFVVSIVGAAADAVAGFWHPYYFPIAAVMLWSAVLWRRVLRKQRALYGARR